MTQEERRIYLIQELQKEMPEYAGYQIPEDEQGQKDLLLPATEECILDVDIEQNVMTVHLLDGLLDL